MAPGGEPAPRGELEEVTPSPPAVDWDSDDDDDHEVDGAATDGAGGVLDDMHPQWRRKKKHLFVLSHAGKPIFSRYGDENALAGFMASLQAMISFVKDSGDTLNSVRAGNHLFVFLTRGPLYLVAVAATGEPVPVLAAQLDLFHKQLIAILTNAVEKTFERSAKFDMRQLLGGTAPVLRSLIHSFTWDPALLVGAIPPLPLRSAHRQELTSQLAALQLPGLQFALLLAGTQVVSLVAPSRAPMHHEDLLLLSNFVRSSESFRLSESFSPVCLPHYNPAAFLYTYISYIERDVCLLLLTTAPESFYDLAAARQTLEASLRAADVFTAVRDMQQTPLLQLDRIPGVAGGGQVGQTPLWHFLYHHTGLGQVVASAFRVPLQQKYIQKRVLRQYHQVHAMAHSKDKAEQHRVHFRASPSNVLLLCVGQEFELYTTFDPLTDKASAVTICNRLCSWLNQNEATLFMSPYPSYF